MPNLQNAKKALRQSEKRRKRNEPVLGEMHSLRRKLRKSVEAGKLDEAKQLMPTLNKKADKAVQKGIYKRNKVARIKSRAMAMIRRAEAK
jgi:small subunit ribosomal protein S20